MFTCMCVCVGGGGVGGGGRGGGVGVEREKAIEMVNKDGVCCPAFSLRVCFEGKPEKCNTE